MTSSLTSYWSQFRPDVIALIQSVYKPEDQIINTRSLAWYAVRSGMFLPQGSSESYCVQLLSSVVYRNIGARPYTPGPFPRRGRATYILPVPVGELR